MRLSDGWRRVLLIVRSFDSPPQIATQLVCCQDRLKLWKCQFPNVQVTLDCSFSTDIWKRYKNGEFDIALAQHCPSDIDAEPIRVEPLEWVALEIRRLETEYATRRFIRVRLP